MDLLTTQIAKLGNVPDAGKPDLAALDAGETGAGTFADLLALPVNSNGKHSFGGTETALISGDAGILGDADGGTEPEPASNASNAEVPPERGSAGQLIPPESLDVLQVAAGGPSAPSVRGRFAADLGEGRAQASQPHPELPSLIRPQGIPAPQSAETAKIATEGAPALGLRSHIADADFIPLASHPVPPLNNETGAHDSRPAVDFESKVQPGTEPAKPAQPALPAQSPGDTALKQAPGEILQIRDAAKSATETIPTAHDLIDGKTKSARTAVNEDVFNINTKNATAEAAPDRNASAPQKPNSEEIGRPGAQVAAHAGAFKTIISAAGRALTYSLPNHGEGETPLTGLSNMTLPTSTQIRVGTVNGLAASPQLPINAIAAHIASQAVHGARRFDIRLDPPELGRVHVRLEIARDGAVTTHLVVERAETLDLLQRDARALQGALEDAGLETSDDGLSFSLKDEGFDDSFADRKADDDTLSGKTPADDAPEELAADAGQTSEYRLSRGLDIRI